jgi:hypothetical protein
MGCN